MTPEYNAWARARKQSESLAKLDHDPKAYFAAVDLLDRLEKALAGERV